MGLPVLQTLSGYRRTNFLSQIWGSHNGEGVDCVFQSAKFQLGRFPVEEKMLMEKTWNMSRTVSASVISALRSE
jgi:hypothetical protein